MTTQRNSKRQEKILKALMWTHMPTKTKQLMVTPEWVRRMVKQHVPGRLRNWIVKKMNKKERGKGAVPMKTMIAPTMTPWLLIHPRTELNTLRIKLKTTTKKSALRNSKEDPWNSLVGTYLPPGETFPRKACLRKVAVHFQVDLESRALRRLLRPRIKFRVTSPPKEDTKGKSPLSVGRRVSNQNRTGKVMPTVNMPWRRTGNSTQSPGQNPLSNTRRHGATHVRSHSSATHHPRITQRQRATAERRLICGRKARAPSIAGAERHEEDRRPLAGPHLVAMWLTGWENHRSLSLTPTCQPGRGQVILTQTPPDIHRVYKLTVVLPCGLMRVARLVKWSVFFLCSAFLLIFVLGRQSFPQLADLRWTCSGASHFCKKKLFRGFTVDVCDKANLLPRAYLFIYLFNCNIWRMAWQ